MIYTGILFGHGVISVSHSVLHMTSEIIALHDHGHDHDVTDHGEIFKPSEDSEKSKSAHFNMLSLVFFYEASTVIKIAPNNNITSLKAYEYHFLKTRTEAPPTPPPLG